MTLKGFSYGRVHRSDMLGVPAYSRLDAVNTGEEREQHLRPLTSAAARAAAGSSSACRPVAAACIAPAQPAAACAAAVPERYK